MKNLFTVAGESGEWIKGGRRKIKKYRLIMPILIFMLGIRLFFSIFSDNSKAFVEIEAKEIKENALAKAESYESLRKRIFG